MGMKANVGANGFNQTQSMFLEQVYDQICERVNGQPESETMTSDESIVCEYFRYAVTSDLGIQ